MQMVCVCLCMSVQEQRRRYCYNMMSLQINYRKIPCISNLGLLKYMIVHCLDYICLGYIIKMFSVSKDHLLYKINKAFCLI